MSKLATTKELLRRWFTAIPFFVFLGLALGVALAILIIPQPNIATIPISGIIMEQAYTDDILEALKQAREDDSIKAVVLQIDSPGGYVVTTEAIYLDVLRLRQQKPVVASVGMMAASGGDKLYLRYADLSDWQRRRLVEPAGTGKTGRDYLNYRVF